MRKIIPALFFLLTIFSCRKDAPDTLPQVVWNSPADGAHVNVFDTLHVSVHVTDENGLVSADIKLLDAQMTPVLPTVSFSLSGTAQDIVFDWPISNIRLTSGTYYLYAEVSNATNHVRVSRSLNITEVPRALKGFFVATNPSVNSTNIYKVDSTWLPALWVNELTDFTDLAVSSYWQQVYVNGNSNPMLQALSIDGQTPGWSIIPPVTTQPFWGPMSITGSRLWVSYRNDNKIKALDQTGTVKISGTGDGGFYPLHCLQIGDKFFSEQKQISGSTVKMVTYNITGPGLQETLLGMNVLAMFEKDADNVYVVGNNAGQGHLNIYDVAGNGMWEPIALPTGTVTAATQIDSNTVLIAMSSGTIYKFTYAPVGLLTWASGINTSQLCFDEADETVFSAEGLNVKVYDYNPFSFQRTIAIPDSIKDVELWYNR